MLEQEMGDISDSQRGLLCIGIALERFRKFYWAIFIKHYNFWKS